MGLFLWIFSTFYVFYLYMYSMYDIVVIKLQTEKKNNNGKLSM